MSMSRSDRSRFATWWFTVDRVLLAAILVLIGTGIVLSLAASPAVAIKKGFPMYYFVERHVVFSVLAALTMVAVSLLPPIGIRRLALGLLAVSAAGLIVVQFSGEEINGARRWLSIAGHSLQPSEFMKPGFVVLTAWLMAEAHTRKDVPALPLAVLLVLGAAALLVMQPDVGQTLLVAAVWGALFFLSGQSLVGAAALAVLGSVGMVVAYNTFPHVQIRVDRFLTPSAGDFSQVDRAMKSFAEGGFLGRGPGEGTIKTSLPDAHTDFIFAVVAEEYGVIACLALLFLFGFIVMRALMRAAQEPDASTRLAIQGLALIFGLQGLINMGVNVGLLPAKGMTLPFISAGGSSMLAVAVMLGMLLGLTRRRPDPQRLKKRRLMQTMPSFEPMSGTTR
jgi:cell division protein FtsW